LDLAVLNLNIRGFYTKQRRRIPVGASRFSQKCHISTLRRKYTRHQVLRHILLVVTIPYAPLLIVAEIENCQATRHRLQLHILAGVLVLEKFRLLIVAEIENYQATCHRLQLHRLAGVLVLEKFRLLIVDEMENCRTARQRVQFYARPCDKLHSNCPQYDYPDHIVHRLPYPLNCFRYCLAD
jgi:hypothetical protein